MKRHFLELQRGVTGYTGIYYRDRSRVCRMAGSNKAKTSNCRVIQQFDLRCIFPFVLVAKSRISTAVLFHMPPTGHDVFPILYECLL